MSRYSLENKVAVITGAAQGIGLAIAEEFLEKGVQTAILLDKKDGSEKVDALKTKHGPNKVVYMKCDITKDLETIWKCIFEMCKTVDILVNNAGVADESSVRKTIETNALATIEWSFRFREHMKEKNKSGTIINIASTYSIQIDPFFPVYVASKCAIFGFSKSIGHPINFSRYGVRIIVVCPGFTKTELGRDGNHMMDKQTWEDFKTHISKAIFQETEVIGKAVAEVYEKADSGTAWVIRDNLPVTQLL